MSIELAGARKRKSPAFSGLPGGFVLLIGACWSSLECSLAERGGFEPPIGYEPIHAFQACDLNHSSISPGFAVAGWHVDEARDYSKTSLRSVPWIRRTRKKPLRPKTKRQSGNRAIGVSPTTFPHKPVLLLPLASSAALWAASSSARVLQLLQNRRVLQR